MFPFSRCAECRERASGRGEKPSCTEIHRDSDGRPVRLCREIGLSPIVRLAPRNRFAWEVCRRAVQLSPADFNGNPTLANLQTALDSFPDEVTAAEYEDLLERVATVYFTFWLPYTKSVRDLSLIHI